MGGDSGVGKKAIGFYHVKPDLLETHKESKRLKRKESFMDCDRDKGFQEGEELEGRYANVFKVGQNAFEFVIDFGQSYVEGKREIFHTRIVSSPFYANVLLKTLQESIERYEKVFESIPEEDEGGEKSS
ncbi:MAG: hypothetical protein CV087_04985 [Candidatus Brocadia sp. WS118]|nr:MAG: hypothetical protein CV087_04985 [Candidatus Brocadia sp. WS118]